MNNDIMQYIMGQKTVTGNARDSRELEAQRQRAQQEHAMAQRTGQLQNTQRAVDLSNALKPKNRFEQIQRNGQMYQVELDGQGKLVGQPQLVGGGQGGAMPQPPMRAGGSPSVGGFNQRPFQMNPAQEKLAEFLPPDLDPSQASLKDWVEAGKASKAPTAVQSQQQATAASKEAREQQKFDLEQADGVAKMARAKDVAVQKYGVMNGTIDEAMKIVKDNEWATGGLTGGINSNIPGTDAYTLDKTINTLQANLSFDALQAMREASKTGGALGSVSERELQLLGSTVASLDSGLPRETIMNNLEKVREHYKNFLDSAGIELPGAQGGGAKEVASQAEFDALPSGAIFTEDGKQYRKP